MKSKHADTVRRRDFQHTQNHSISRVTKDSSRIADNLALVHADQLLASSVCQGLPPRRILYFAMQSLGLAGTESLSLEEAQKLWHFLEVAFYEILKQNAGDFSFEELYRFAYTLVLHKHGDRLYEGTASCFQVQLEKVAEELSLQEDSNTFIRQLLQRWDEHKHGIMLR